ncbi:MAG: hypothetical protein Q8R76_04175 [Candidatus Omnitrophota bacterium]|nr:hypothetical protein [Candidatus Omnitrophota bacterium]
MKIWIIVIFLFMSAAAPALAGSPYDDGRSDKGIFGRIVETEMRGILNAVGTITELVYTPMTEPAKHRYLWPATVVPRTVSNILMRFASAITDIAFMPWVLPFTDDISPLTEAMGMSDYPWKPLEEDF